MLDQKFLLQLDEVPLSSCWIELDQARCDLVYFDYPA